MSQLHLEYEHFLDKFVLFQSCDDVEDVVEAADGEQEFDFHQFLLQDFLSELESKFNLVLSWFVHIDAVYFRLVE